MATLYNADILDVLPNVKPKMVFLDPPDNIGLKYTHYNDDLPLDKYYAWLELILMKSLKVSDCVWLSYYWEHDLEIKYRVRQLLKNYYPSFKAKTIIWRYTFGQHNAHDFGSGFRYLIRFNRYNNPINVANVMVESERQRIGDKRANPDGRVPDDFWHFDLPRVTGNAIERRDWHPTQHPEQLLKRIILSSTKEGDTVFDGFAGTGTTIRVCQYYHRQVIATEIDPEYCANIKKENPTVELTTCLP